MNSYIKVHSIITSPIGEDQKLEFGSEAKIYRKNNYIYIIYDESEISGMNGTKTTIKALSNKVVLKRTGTNISELVFEKGKEHSQIYTTPYGEFIMETKTSKIFIDFNENLVGRLYLEYTLDIKNLGISKHILEIENTKKW